MRLFVALRLDAGMHDRLGELQARLRRLDSHSQVRWVRPEGMHLTLKFLGEVGEPRLPDLEARLAEAVQGRQAPRLALERLGAFPDARRPRVLWVGLRDEGAGLAPLQEAIEAAAELLGWEREKRAFQPHLTLGRVKEDRGGGNRPLPPELLRAVREGTLPDEPARPQTRVELMRSHLSPSGARYEELRTWELPA